MAEPNNGGGAGGTATGARRASTAELIGLLAGRATRLAEKQLDLIKTEVKADVRAEARTAVGLAVAAIFGIVGISLLFVAGAFGVATVIPAWAAALVMAGVAFILGGVVGLVAWRRRVTAPLSATRATVRETWLWAKEQLTGGQS